MKALLVAKIFSALGVILFAVMGYILMVSRFINGGVSDDVRFWLQALIIASSLCTGIALGFFGAHRRWIDVIGQQRVARGLGWALIVCFFLGADVAYLNVSNMVNETHLEHCDFQHNIENWRPYVHHVEVFLCDDGRTRFLFNEATMQRWGV